MARLCEKLEMPKFGTKMCYLGNSGLELYKKLLSYLNLLPRICLTAKFFRKTKMYEFETKNDLFGYSYARI